MEAEEASDKERTSNHQTPSERSHSASSYIYHRPQKTRNISEMLDEYRHRDDVIRYCEGHVIKKPALVSPVLVSVVNLLILTAFNWANLKEVICTDEMISRQTL